MKKINPRLLSGNQAAAEAIRLCRPKVVSAYPITPQTTVVEALAEMHAQGKLPAKFLTVDSESSAMASCFGASLAGSRTATATSSQGLLFMAENVYWAASSRCPIMMVNVDRALCHPWGLWSDTCASMAMKDYGWLMFYCEDAQDILDTTIIAYRLAEELLLPVMISYDGFRCSHAYEGVYVPTQEEVDAFLPPYKPRFKMDSATPYSFGNLAQPDHYAKLRYRQHHAILRAPALARKFSGEFRRIFGRSRKMILEEGGARYANTIVLASGSKASVIRNVIGERADLGLVKLKMFRPWPEKELLESLDLAGRIIVIDDNISCGQGGHIWRELRASFFGRRGHISPDVLGYIYGLNGQDFTPDAIENIIRDAGKRKSNNKPVLWGEEKISVRRQREKTPVQIGSNRTDLSPDIGLGPGHTACAGCGAAIAMKQALKGLGPDIAMVIPACCWTILQGAGGGSSMPHTPVLHTAFGSAAATACGLKAGLEEEGKDTAVVVWGGDGSTYDIGLGGISGAAERNDNIVYICYNNQAYMNTGVQKSSATPPGVVTTTTPAGALKTGPAKRMPFIMAEHKVPYVATASLFYFKDLQRKVKKARETKGFSYIEILAPCTAGWKFPSDMTVELSRLAVQTGFYPLFEIENGVLSINKPSPGKELLLIGDYIKSQGRYKNLLKSAELLAALQAEVNANWEILKKMNQK